ncbi:MAG: hypothetical protein A3A87_02015 [Candidatus Muproteobacteria bacterium RIFCSPLOWO2_01_FULL_60_18]|uniref:Uncharacterized protein n=1 Tax=Candidatus Muproteobacteria bacterium RIFCSPLOWO2_01_FULL_60_18 TaxID=1817768 RepID=A0A1F6TYV3_9PROT|nr:MAG: hypothetical protein A3A87_02015 [Candidatus Muproteobacteria bacterium RIFCSPLOWO2_01_FULL_60_18]
MHDRHQIVQNPVGHVLVEMPLVAVGPDIKFQGLQLHAQPVRDVFQGQAGEVRLAGPGTQTGELRTFDLDDIIPVRMRIGEGIQILAGLGRHGLAAGFGILVKL